MNTIAKFVIGAASILAVALLVSDDDTKETLQDNTDQPTQTLGKKRIAEIRKAKQESQLKTTKKKPKKKVVETAE
jgi:hypothetical protein